MKYTWIGINVLDIKAVTIRKCCMCKVLPTWRRMSFYLLTHGSDVSHLQIMVQVTSESQSYHTRNK